MLAGDGETTGGYVATLPVETITPPVASPPKPYPCCPGLTETQSRVDALETTAGHSETVHVELFAKIDNFKWWLIGTLLTLLVSAIGGAFTLLMFVLKLLVKK